MADDFAQSTLRMKNIILVSLVMSVVGCKGSTKAEPCDGSSIGSLSKSDGKQVAFAGCTFQGQGNDVVSFGPTGGGPSVDCTMKGGEGAVKEFHTAAMKILDVRGVLAKDALKDCEITTSRGA
ncbi:MAG: hypothetical protein ABI467_17640 [Kofleriaceae bacterium]